ncbi:MULTISPECIES: plasmid IncI1-type surface exclusion protein ExcA [Enterobacter cloacae complex]|uniref:plasmid IncI1-type surface exclusion protein ExcA n=1 Tax=Enterobacter cloacae complex TaxID=354276 RepID=UPI00288B38FC|nr:plasmid IncI1-type surface exclusion protein ExcA [Enterobacter ludwigii]WNI98567.1 plasmid IncI1-type surface exclusion protein ExcA [Enterobacter ludwigii]WNJ07492.1 plasmid IncI1-type surface exclusion protein ExcA [Enterobacter ludwigii]
MKDRFPKWWLPYYVVRTLFLRFGVITLALLAPLFTLYVASGDYVTGSDYVFLFSLWFILFAPFIINHGIANNRKKKIFAVIEKIKETGLFKPESNSEGWLFWQSTYLGFDFQKGTFLYVRIYPGNVMDVIGFDAYSLTRTEVEDSKLRLFTKFTSLPMIPIDTGAASNIANHLHAMNNKGYSYDFNFNDVVNKKRAEIEALTGLPVPVLA